jgi:DNA ligase (NAD+)
MSEHKFNNEQLSIIKKVDNSINAKLLDEVFSRSKSGLSIDDLLTVLKIANALYRSGLEVFNDDVYDAYISELKSRNTEHPYISTI